MNPIRNSVVWFEIYVTNMERAKKFYETTFQLTLNPLPSPNLEMWAFPFDTTAPGCSGALAKMQDKDPGNGGTIIYFSSSDCEIEAQRAAEAGGTVHLPKTSIGPYGFIALINDTEGNLIGVHSMT